MTAATSSTLPQKWAGRSPQTLLRLQSLGLTLGANPYNTLNHANFANPISNLASSSNFGMITLAVQPPTSPYGAFAPAATDARIVQVMARITLLINSINSFVSKKAADRPPSLHQARSATTKAVSTIR